MHHGPAFHGEKHGPDLVGIGGLRLNAHHPIYYIPYSHFFIASPSQNGMASCAVRALCESTGVKARTDALSVKRSSLLPLVIWYMPSALPPGYLFFPTLLSE